MLRFLGGCAGRLLGAVLMVGVLVAAWANRDALVELAGRALDREPEVSEALAADALVELEGLMTGAHSRVALRQPELQSLITFVWAPLLPEGLVDPRVGIGAGRITLSGDVPTATFTGIAELREIAGFLPDTASLRAVGSFVPMDGGRVALEVHELGAAGIPIPGRLIPPILDQLAVFRDPDAGPNVLALPLPPAVTGVYVSGDSLVIIGRDGGDQD